MTAAVIMVWGVCVPTLAVLVLVALVLLVAPPRVAPVVQPVTDVESATVTAYAELAMARAEVARRS